jgi:hypothetical protein
MEVGAGAEGGMNSYASFIDDDNIREAKTADEPQDISYALARERQSRCDALNEACHNFLG